MVLNHQKEMRWVIRTAGLCICIVLFCWGGIAEAKERRGIDTDQRGSNRDGLEGAKGTDSEGAEGKGKRRRQFRGGNGEGRKEAEVGGGGGGDGENSKANETRPSEKRTMGKAVMVLSRARKDVSKELLQAVKSQLSDAPVDFSSHWVDKIPGALSERLELAGKIAGKNGTVVVFWCDLKTAGGHVYVAEPETGRMLIRKLGEGSGSAGVDALAIIVRASVMAFLRESRLRERQGGKGKGRVEEGRKGVDRREDVQDKKKVSKGGGEKNIESVGESEELGPGSLIEREGLEEEDDFGPESFRLALELGYSLDSYSADHLAVHGLWLGLSVRVLKEWWIYGSYRLGIPIDINDGRVDSTMVRHPVSVGMRWQRGIDRWTLGVSGALIVDYSTHKITASAGVEPAAKRGYVVFSTSTLFVVGVKIYERLRILAGLGVELGLNTQRYILDVFGEKNVLLDPFPLRPTGSINIVVDVF